MMWRERIAAARARGGFTDEDVRLANNLTTCAVGEVHFGNEIAATDFCSARLPGEVWVMGHVLSGRFTIAVRENDITLAEDTLAAIEDRVLALKREARP